MNKQRLWVFAGVITIVVMIAIGATIVLGNIQWTGGQATSSNELALNVAVDRASAAMPQSANTVSSTQSAGMINLTNNGGASPSMQLATIADAAAEESEAEAIDTMIFEDYGVNPFVEAAQDNLSTFAMDVDTGSYTLARSYLVEYGTLPDAASIRPEEFINYHPADYAAPSGNEAFAIHLDAAPSPYSEADQVLLRVGVQGRTIAPADRDAALLIFVVDVSGSMAQTNRLDLAKDALQVLVEQLREDDRVGIVIYADEARIVLDPTPASDAETIINAIQSLQTQGSTYAEAGLALGYQMATTHMRAAQTTRVVLVSDGVANVGATGPDAILDTISQGVESGVTLSTIGVGMGNFNDVMMEQLANDGNGNYHYVDNIREARRIFVNNLTSTLQVIGYDAKIQVEFNPEIIVQYRLIGYENRAVADNQFRDDSVDAGEVGAGHSITALYELDLLADATSGTLATAYIRYQDAQSRAVVEINQSLMLDDVQQTFDQMPVAFQRQAALAEFSEILRDSPFASVNYDALVDRLAPYAANDPATAEIIRMIRQAQQVS